MRFQSTAVTHAGTFVACTTLVINLLVSVCTGCWCGWQWPLKVLSSARPTKSVVMHRWRVYMDGRPSVLAVVGSHAAVGTVRHRWLHNMYAFQQCKCCCSCVHAGLASQVGRWAPQTPAQATRLQ
jgi:hypothetical protein